MGNCQPQEGIFVPKCNTLTFEQDRMQIGICCRLYANHRRTVAFTFRDGDVVILSREFTLVEGLDMKLGLARTWEPFQNQVVGWFSTQTPQIEDKGYRFMVNTRSGLLRRGIKLLL